MPRRKEASPLNSIALAREKTRIQHLHIGRDCFAQECLRRGLSKLGYADGPILFNAPPTREERSLTTPPIAAVDISSRHRGDVIYCSGRPDTTGPEVPRKLNQPHCTDLQVEISDYWREYLEVFERRHIRLQPQLQQLLPQQYADRMELFVGERSPSRLCESDPRNGGPRKLWKRASRTPVFLLRVNEFRPKGPDLIHAFGPDGTTTMIWSALLSETQLDLLESPGFTYAEIYGGAVPSRATDLLWVNDWKVTVVLRVPPPQGEFRAPI